MLNAISDHPSVAWEIVYFSYHVPQTANEVGEEEYQGSYHK